MKNFKSFESFNLLNESKNDKSPLKDPKKKFVVSKPKSMTREEIFNEIVQIAEFMYDKEEFDVDQLAIALQDDKLCQKFIDKYTKIMNDFYDEQDLFDSRTDTESDFLGDFISENKALKKCIVEIDED